MQCFSPAATVFLARIHGKMATKENNIVAQFCQKRRPLSKQVTPVILYTCDFIIICYCY
jgi:hypothetical protein